MKHRLFDMHCDTPFELYKKKQELKSNNLHVSLERAEAFESYTQFAAIWCDSSLDDEAAYSMFWQIMKNFKAQIDNNKNTCMLCTSFDDYDMNDGVKNRFFLSVEDARLLNSDISRLDDIYDAGVRLLTLNWKGESSIGGAHDTNIPLTKFGRDVVKRAFDLNMIVDISHSSYKVADEVFELAEEFGKPVIASHSNSREISHHPRNLTDEQFRKIISLGGIVGISLVPEHLNLSGAASIDDIVNHIHHYVTLGGNHTVCLGCDFDGCNSLPDGIDNIGDIGKIAEALSQKNYTDELIEDILYNNAYNFIKKIKM